MATYAFKAIDAKGGPAQGEVEGTDEATVLGQLRARGLIILKFDEKKPTDVGDVFGRFKPIKTRDLAIMTRQLSTMIDAGVPLLKTLYVLEDQVTNEKLRRAFVDVRKQVESGNALSDSLARHPGIFNELYISMVRAGEAGGILDETLIRVADQLEKADSLKRQIRAAMTYPIMIGSFAMAVLIALVVFLIPVFEKVFKDIDPSMETEMPAITKVSIGASHLMTQRWYLVIAGIVLLIVAIRQWKNSHSGRQKWDKIKLKIPFRIGKVVQKVALARFSRTFAGLAGGGVPVLETIQITSHTAGNAVIAEAMESVYQSVRSGGTIAQPMRAAPQAFPAMVPHMIEIGEKSGSLEQMLDKVADFYEDEVATAVKSLSSLLEPLMLIVVGVIVGFIVISMYLPMFEIYEKLR